jgi:hypothetical protein
MHCPQLINEVLQLKLNLDLCEPSETASTQAEIDSRIDSICLIAKKSKSDTEAVIDRRYRAFIKERHAAGGLRTEAKTLTFPTKTVLD